MSPRQVGSGTATGEANACARILAAQFCGDGSALRHAKREFSDARSRRSELGAGGGRGFSAERLATLLGRVPAALSLSVRAARACGPGEAGDVVVECKGGQSVRIEIKAQLTLEDFTWIQSADWIRGETDFLAALVEENPTASACLSGALRDLVLDSYDRDPGWGLSPLWVADVAGITSRRVRRRVGVFTPADLKSFLANKYIVHLTQEGLRTFRLSDVPNVAAAQAGVVKYRLFGPRRGSRLTVWTRGDGRMPVRGGIHLTYYVGQNGRADLGGHHVHDAMFAGARPLLKAT